MNVNAQIRDFGTFMATGTEDAEKLLEGYLSPFLNGFGASMTGGWYNTAKPHQLGGFDITLSFNTAIAAPDARTFNVDDLKLTNLVRADGAPLNSQTIAGSDDSGPYMRYNYTAYNDTAFQLPPGTGIHFVPSPMISAAVGLVKGTEIMGRFLPKIGNDVGKLGFWGVGLKHDIKQWIPAMEKIPVLNISVMGGYTKMNAHIAVDIDEFDIGLGGYYDGDPEAWNDQKLEWVTTSFTGNLLVSADLPIVCFYGGVGFATTKTNLKMAGYFPTIDGINTNLEPVVVAAKDPVDFEVKNQDDGFTKPRLNAGIRFKFGIFTLHFDYTRANYNVFTGGLGFSFR
jgi:hypothetical protein